MAEIVPTFVGAEALEALAEERPEGLDGPAAGGAHEGLQFRETEFDRVEVRTVGREIPERGARLLDRPAHARDFVGAEVVGDDPVAGVQGRDENLFDVGEETRPVDRAIEDAGRAKPGDAQGGEKRAGLPAPERRVVVDAYAPRGAPIAPQQIRGHARFVEKDQGRRIPQRRLMPPGNPGGGDVRPVVLAGADGFF